MFSIGEISIDLISCQKGTALKDVISFTQVPGGAPANVDATVAKFDGTASLNQIKMKMPLVIFFWNNEERKKQIKACFLSFLRENHTFTNGSLKHLR